MPSHTELGEFIWRIADHLRGDYEKNDNEDVILPFTLLRRLDCVLEKTRDKVRETEATIAGRVRRDAQFRFSLLFNAALLLLLNKAGYCF
jgi:type I restriction-modification system DNA methylase subunit